MRAYVSKPLKMASVSPMLFLTPLPPPSKQFVKSFLRTIATTISSRVESLFISVKSNGPILITQAPIKASLLATSTTTAFPPSATVASLIPLSYHVHRTASRQLPVYHLAKRGGNLHQTRIRKIDGSINDLRNELQVALGLKEEHIVINQITRHIIIKVAYVLI